MTEDGGALPSQTPLYHSLNNSRYSRQEMIRQVEEVTGRRLVVYFSTPPIFADGLDILGFGDLLNNISGDPIDLLLQSPGGDIDVAEKIVYLCRARSGSFRVIVPDSAKSAATLIALASDEVVMGDTSELGPIDAQIEIETPQGIVRRPAQSFLDGLDAIKAEAESIGALSPAHYPLLANLDPALLDFCRKSIMRAQRFAEKWLLRYQLQGDTERAATVARELADNNRWLSHGAVIDAKEAIDLGLTVRQLSHQDPLWQRIWRLYCRYRTDSRTEGYQKMFESRDVSLPYA